MQNKKEILIAMRKAMQGEIDSINLYQESAIKSTDKEVKKFFCERVEEEKKHYNFLLKAYKDIDTDKSPVDLTIELTNSHPYTPIINPDFVKRLAENSFIFSAISTGILLEKTSFDYYEKQAQEAQIDEIKKLYNVLADWEKTHYDDLLKLQKETEKIYWEINNFEPF
jgi:rubrerythrin